MYIAVRTLFRLRVKLYHVADRTRDLVFVCVLVVPSRNWMEWFEYSVACWVGTFDVERAQAVKEVNNFFALSSCLFVSNCEVTSEEFFHCLKYWHQHWQSLNSHLGLHDITQVALHVLQHCQNQTFHLIQPFKISFCQFGMVETICGNWKFSEGLVDEAQHFNCALEVNWVVNFKNGVRRLEKSLQNIDNRSGRLIVPAVVTLPTHHALLYSLHNCIYKWITLDFIDLSKVD